MTWVKIDDDFYMHPKVAALDLEMLPAAVGLHTLALSWCADQLTDGRIPRPQVCRLLGSTSAYVLADELVRVRLWEVKDGEYQIHDYLAYNPSREKVLEEREAARLRMSQHRSREVPPNIDGSSAPPVPVPVPDVRRITSGEKPVENPGGGRLSAAEDALRSVIGYPFDPKKDRGRLRDLNQAFPEVDLAREILKWAGWMEDQKAKKAHGWKPNYRLSLWNWVEKAAEIRRRDAPATGNGHAPPSTLVRPDMVASLAAMVADGARPEDLRSMCASEAEYAALLGNCPPAKRMVTG